MMRRAEKEGNDIMAKGHLMSATEAYLDGFRLAPMDTYTGINAIRLLLQQGRRSEAEQLGPIVLFAAERTKEQSSWDIATLLELAILLGDEERAELTARRFLSMVHEAWEAEVIANNLRDLRNCTMSSPEFLEKIIGGIRAASSPSENVHRPPK
jgi:hypothetical protein